MKHLRFIFQTTVLSLCISTFTSGQNIILRQNHENGIYHSGDNVRVTLFLSDKSTTAVSLKIQKNFGKQIENQLAYSGDTLVVFNQVLNEPTNLVFTAKAPYDSGSIGLIVDPEKFTPSTKRPKDFEAFWDTQKKALRALPLEVKYFPVTKNIPEGYKCFDVEINSLGPRPARGYFAKPENAKPKSLPIVIFFHPAGVSANWCLSKTDNALKYAKIGIGALSLDLNAHGILNGQPQSYYDSLNKGELNEYQLQGMENKRETYFLGMYYRLLRAIDFLTSQPEWDGKRILVIGESQGGGQSLAAAGLDERVTAAVVTVPAMCDWGGTLAGRKGSWPFPFSSQNLAKHDKTKLLETLPYFDIAHIIKGTKAIIVAEVGLIDQTCPSSAVFSALNQVESKKIILTPPYRAHRFDQTVYKEIWQKTVNKTKEDFIKDYLK